MKRYLWGSLEERYILFLREFVTNIDIFTDSRPAENWG